MKHLISHRPASEIAACFAVRIAAVTAAAVLTAGWLVPTTSLGQAARTGYKLEKVTAEMVKTPDYNFSGDKRRTPPPADWLEIEVEFETQLPMTEELTLQYYVAVEGADRVFHLLSGESTLVNVMEGKGHFAVMYVSPRSLARLTENAGFSAKNIQNIHVDILKAGQLVASGNLNNSGGNKEWWRGPGLVPAPGLLLDKSRTPFAPLFWDRYEESRPSGR